MSDTFDSSAVQTPDHEETGGLFLSLVAISVMALLFGRKISSTNFSSLNYARALVVILNVVSWLFSFSSALLAQTNNGNHVSCDLSIFFCISLYASSKILIYLFLMERVHVVTAIGVTRWNSKLFRFNILLLTPYFGIIVIGILYRVSKIYPDGKCYIGLEDVVSFPLITYDSLLSIWLTTLFLRVLISSTSQLQGPTKSKLREVARKTLIGSILSLIFSTTNVASIVYFRGYQRGVLCLTFCTLDVTLNVITIHWVTTRGRNSAPRSSSSGGGRLSRIDPSPGGIDRQLETHISVSVESYVEEYHQMHIANKLPLPERPILSKINE
ncbi:hypothetical protein BGX21_003018 [Mortierella sp. AD011]|nr:hypothetical protein BGX20_004154 [Mortierella sp. AD010]KAF9403524.1 hypothetical protein BGX21_003018 [Mortierella sp. AD011]